MKFQIKKISASLLITTIVLYNQLSLIAFAEEMPSRENMTQEIRQQVASQPVVETNSNLTNTGDNAQADTSSQNNSETQVNNNNQANVNQTVEAEANTGNNEASRNISIGGDAGMITTGNALVNTNLQANVNNNATGINGNSGSGSAAQGAVITSGNGVSTNTTAQSTLNTFVTNKNTTYINQLVNSTANTGNNIADRNISVGGLSGVISTGNALTSTNYLVTANGSVALIGGNGNENGPGSGASIVLLNTGDNSRFATNSSQKTNIAVNNENRADINQICGDCNANTGYNVVNRTINRQGDAGIIETGNAVVNVNLLANANNNKTYIDGGGSNANNQQDVTNTGNNADVQSSSDSSNSTNVNNTNQANVNQFVNANANTGHNVANRNISIGGDAGVIKTGNALINVMLGVNVNSNLTNLLPDIINFISGKGVKINK